MKILLFVILFTSSLACNRVSSTTQTNANSNATVSRRASDDNSKVNGQSFTLNEQGISFILPRDWRKDESTEADEGEFTWHGPDKAEFAITVAFYKPEYGGRSIAEETEKFYRDHKEGGSEDVRLLEINSVRGVHFLVDDEVWKVRHGHPEKELYRFIKWSSQRMYRGKRQIIFVTLSAPVRGFSRHRDTLYGILNSIKFIQE